MATTIKLSPDANFNYPLDIAMSSVMTSIFHKIFIAICICFLIGAILFVITKKKKFINIPLILFAILIIVLILITIYAVISVPQVNAFNFFWYSVRGIVYTKIW